MLSIPNTIEGHETRSKQTHLTLLNGVGIFEMPCARMTVVGLLGEAGLANTMPGTQGTNKCCQSQTRSRGMKQGVSKSINRVHIFEILFLPRKELKVFEWSHHFPLTESPVSLKWSRHFRNAVTNCGLHFHFEWIRHFRML